MAGAITPNYLRIKNPELRRAIRDDVVDALFDITAGHDHDGVNSPTLSPAAVIAAGSVATVAIVDGAVTAAKLGDAAVTTTKLLDDAVTAAKIADGTITNALMAANSIDSDQYVDASIDTAHIGNLQITTALIAADAINGTKLADNAVDSEHITAGAIDAAHFAAGAVDATALASNAVTTAKILAANVTNAKLADLARGSIKVGGADDAVTDLVAKTDGYILIGDGQDLKSVAVSGDVTIVNTGATTIGAGKVLATMLAAGAQPLTTAIADPGDAGAIPITNSGYVPIVQTGAAETRTLAAPTFAGQLLLIDSKTYAADTVITVEATLNGTGNNTITLNAEGDFILLVGIDKGASKVWRVVASDGVTLSTAG